MTENGRRDRGAVLPIVALVLPVLILMTAFAVDLGRQRSSRRTMQARADMIALDLVRLTDERILQDVLTGDATHESAAVALAKSATRNNVLVSQITLVEWGTFTAASGFIASNVPASIPNAVRVTAEESTDYFFQPGDGDVIRSAVATTGDEPTAGFSMGSFGAAISDEEAGVLNAILTPLFGSPATLNVLSYKGLATATLGIGELGAELGLLTPDEVFNTEVATEDVILAAATVLRRNGDTANADVLEGTITSQTEAMGSITLGQLVQASAEDGQDSAMAATVDALGILKTTALLSQCTDPNDLSTCSGLNVPVFSTTLPLLTSAGSLNLIQGPVSAYGPVGTDAKTSQIGLNYGAVLGAQAVGTCVPSVANAFCLLNGIAVGRVDAKVTVTADLELAQGIGEITGIGCGSPLTLDVATRTGLYVANLDVVVEFGRRGVLGGALGPTIGSLHLVASTNQLDTVDTAHFEIPPDVYELTVDQTGNGSVGLSTLSLAAVGGTGVLGTLGTLGITYTTAQVVTNLVNPLLTAFDTGVLGPISDVLGLNVVGADISPLTEIKCNDTLLQLVG